MPQIALPHHLQLYPQHLLTCSQHRRCIIQFNHREHVTNHWPQPHHCLPSTVCRRTIRSRLPFSKNELYTEYLGCTNGARRRGRRCTWRSGRRAIECGNQCGAAAVAEQSSAGAAGARGGREGREQAAMAEVGFARVSSAECWLWHGLGPGLGFGCFINATALPQHKHY